MYRFVIFREFRPTFGIQYCRVQIDRLEKAGQFPKRVQIGPGRVGWLQSEIDEWIAAKAAARVRPQVG